MMQVAAFGGGGSSRLPGECVGSNNDTETECRAGTGQNQATRLAGAEFAVQRPRPLEYSVHQVTQLLSA